MEHPSAGQLRRAMDVLLELNQLQELDEYPGTVSHLLRELIPCEHASYTAVDPSSGRTRVAASPEPNFFEGGQEIFGQLLVQNPLVEHYARTGDGSAKRISDFITRRKLHRTELYEHIYSRIGVEYQMAIVLPSPGLLSGRASEMVGLTLSRSTRDFGARERQLLEMLRPHLHNALERLHQSALASALRAGEEQREWVMLVNFEGVVALASAASRADLKLHSGMPLPIEIREWVRSERNRLRVGSADTGTGVRMFTLQGRRVLARLQRQVHGELDSLRLIALAGAPTLEQLLTLGLTRRQAEVLARALEGESSPGISRTLDLSTRTVEKHFEAIYARLGVNGRAQAIMYVMQALGTRHHRHPGSLDTEHIE